MPPSLETIHSINTNPAREQTMQGIILNNRCVALTEAQSPLKAWERPAEPFQVYDKYFHLVEPDDVREAGGQLNWLSA
jgi:hypothetical protein